MIYALPALLALGLKGFLIFWAKRSLKDSWPLFAMLGFLALQNVVELSFFIPAFSGWRELVMDAYFVSAFFAVTSAALFGLWMWKKPLVTRHLAVGAYIFSTIFSILFCTTDLFVTGYQELSFSMTRIPGILYPLVSLYLIGSLGFMIVAIFLAARSTNDQFLKIRNYLIVAGLAPFVASGVGITILMALSVKINAAMVIPVAMSFFLFVLVYAMTSDRLFDVRTLIPGTSQFKSLTDVMVMATIIRREKVKVPQGRRTDPLDSLQAELYRRALESTGGNKTQAAKQLNIHPNTFRYRLKKLGVSTQI
ncbi:MAG: hypothetical protein ACI8P9_003371 [Parasphingorhabdus sp.]|jgi:hypothetical protein